MKFAMTTYSSSTAVCRATLRRVAVGGVVWAIQSQMHLASDVHQAGGYDG
tara:strand:+ start:208 stop:357 length:150 start_codon:yes stop_codon:yes gene_type:complete